MKIIGKLSKGPTVLSVNLSEVPLHLDMLHGIRSRICEMAPPIPVGLRQLTG